VVNKRKKKGGRWPRGGEGFVRTVRGNSGAILTGTLLAIDPASGKTSMPGYALFYAGQLKEHGTIEIDPSRPPEDRLVELSECLKRDFHGVDVLAVEKLRGAIVQPVLHASVWFTRVAVRAPIVIEVPIHYWKVLAKETQGYAKADDLDALMIGSTLIELAREHTAAS
jgi:hypothetical protein